jgi:hypothetical protein
MINELEPNPNVNANANEVGPVGPVDDKKIRVFRHVSTYYPLSKNPTYITLPEYAFLDNIIHRFIQQHQTISIHDVIYENLQLLVPDVIAQYTNDLPPEKLATWIKLSRLYMKLIYDEFQQKCYEEEAKLAVLFRQYEQRKKFDITWLERLPEDMVSHIYTFLPYRVRCSILLDRYPISKIKDDLFQLRAPLLRGLTVHVHENYYMKIGAEGAFPIAFTRLYKNKTQSITQLMDLLQQLMVHPVSLTRNIDTFSFMLLRTLVYLTIRRR